MDKRDLELLFFIAEKREPTIAEIVEHFAGKWGVSRVAVYLRVKKLIDSNILKKHRIARKIIRISFSTDFLALIETIYGLMHGQAKYWYDRVRKKWVEQG